jgi:hypothetical protein
MVHLPTAAFRALRTAKFLSRREGWRIVREKLQAPEGSYDADIYSLLRACEIYATYNRISDAESLAAVSAPGRERWHEEDPACRGPGRAD